jgi:hypothetical protein
MTDIKSATDVPIPRIERHVDQQQLALLRVAEESERGLTKWAATLYRGASS